MNIAITPDFEPHKTLESEVIEFLKEQDFYVHDSTYHTVMPDELRKRLQRMFTPTALYLRSRADRIAIHKHLNIAFEFECKTHNPKDQKYEDMTIEMLPLIHHISKSKLGVNCLYIYRHIREENNGNQTVISNCGFWIKDLPPIRIIMIPGTRWSPQGVEWFESLAHCFLSEVPIINPPKVNGTGDPLLIIDKQELEKLIDWKQMVLDFIEINRG